MTKQAMMMDFPDVKALIITVCRYSPSQNIQAKLHTIVYCVITCRIWHQTWNIETENSQHPFKGGGGGVTYVFDWIK